MPNLVSQFKEMINGLSLVRKISMGLVLAMAVTVIGYVIHVSGLSSLEPLYTNLNSQDMGSIITILDKQGVRYEVDQDKRTVMVPSTSVLEVRLKLAAEGLPRFGGVGFELFDKGGFGMSEFEQKVNFQRALEGELARTISGIREVESVRVHLVLPEKSLFTESQQSASAAVILKLGSQGTLSQSKVNAITHIIASAVEGLDSDKVSIMDTAGHLLSSGSGDPSVAAGAQIFDQKIQIERSIERRVTELLTPIVGLGKAIVHVTANVDFTRTESTDEVVDPTKVAVLTESRTSAKKSESSSGSGGAAGAAANAPGGGGAAGTSGGGSADEGSEQISYQVSKSVRRQVTPMGSVKSLAVAILVDGTSVDKGGKKTYTPRTAEDLKKIEELAKSAIGFSTERGDQLKIENMPFQSPEDNLAQSEAWYKKKTTLGFLTGVIANVIVVLMSLLILFFVIRPLMRTWSQGANPQGLIPGSPGLLQAGGGSDVKMLVQSNPTAAANAIREWLK